MKSLYLKWKQTSFLLKLLIGMVIGAILGIVFGESILVIKPFGTVFLNLLKMIVLPMIMCSLIAGISSVSDTKSVGRFGIKIFVYFFATTMFASAIGLLLASIIRPGVGFVLGEPFQAEITELPSFVDTIVDMFPTNIFESLSSGNYSHVLIFSIFAGIGIIKLPAEKREAVHHFFELGTDLVSSILNVILGYAPIGVCALVASCVGQYGPMFFTFAVKFLAVNYLSVFGMICVYLLLLFIFSRRTPLSFLKAALPSMLTAFGTQSSAAVLPLNMECAEKLGGKKSVYSFAIPLGSQLNKDGTAILLGCSFLFAAQAAGVAVDLSTMVKVILMALLLTTGYSTTVAGGAVVSVTIMIEAFNLPVETIAVVSGSLALIDGILTMGNCLGTLVGTMIVSDSEVRKDKKLAAKGGANS